MQPCPGHLCVLSSLMCIYMCSCCELMCISVCRFVQFMFLRSFSVLFLCRCARCTQSLVPPSKDRIAKPGRVTPTQGSCRVMTASGQQMVDAHLA